MSKVLGYHGSMTIRIDIVSATREGVNEQADYYLNFLKSLPASPSMTHDLWTQGLYAQEKGRQESGDHK